MSSKPELELLWELAKLLKRYGSDTFDELARTLSSPDFSERLVSILSATAKTGRTASAKSVDMPERSQSPRDFRSSLVAMEELEPEKSALLARFYDSLAAKIVLPTLRDMQAFAADSGLPPLKAKARDKAVVPLVKAMAQWSLGELQARLATIKTTTSDGDRSLEGWSNLILDRERRTKK